MNDATVFCTQEDKEAARELAEKLQAELNEVCGVWCMVCGVWCSFN